MRLAAQAKLGYYPIPEPVIDLIASHFGLSCPPENLAIIDPCCGEGAALNRLARLLGIPPSRVAGIELDAERSITAAAAIPGALIKGPAGFQACHVLPRPCVSLAWVNPPFDNELGGGRREEHTFAAAAGALVVPGGVLALCMPERAWWLSPKTRALFDRWYTDVRLMRFPKEHRKYDECVIVGARRKSGITSKEVPNGQAWEYASQWQIDNPNSYTGSHWRRKIGYLGDDAIRWSLPPAPGAATIEKLEYTDAELAAEIEASPLNRLLQPPEPRPLVSPPMSLGDGHIALLLSGGHLDGLVRGEGIPTHVVRGTAKKVQYLKERTELEDGVREVFGERIVLTVRIIDESGSIRTFEQS